MYSLRRFSVEAFITLPSPIAWTVFLRSLLTMIELLIIKLESRPVTHSELWALHQRLQNPIAIQVNDFHPFRFANVYFE